jgi:hypothetical protein
VFVNTGGEHADLRLADRALTGHAIDAGDRAEDVDWLAAQEVLGGDETKESVNQVGTGGFFTGSVAAKLRGSGKQVAASLVKARRSATGNRGTDPTVGAGVRGNG